MSENGKAVPVETRMIEVATLGENDVQVIRSKDGEIKLFKSSVPLSVASRTLVAIRGLGHYEGDKWIPTYVIPADGFKLMASRAGLLTLNAPTVVVDGKEQANPCVIRSPEGHVRQVYCRAMTAGYTPLGVPVVSDRTVVFDIGLYRIVDLLAKAKSAPAAFKMLPADHPSPGKSWARYRVDDSIILWADTEAKDFRDWLSSMVNRERKAVEIAQTFAQRNSIKHHPCIPIHVVEGSPTAVVPILCWRPTSGVMRWDMSKFSDATRMVTDMATGGVDRPAEVVAGVDAIHEDPDLLAAEAGAGEVDEHDTPTDEPGTPAAPVASSESAKRKGASARRVKVLEDIDKLSAVSDMLQWSEACASVGIKLDQGDDWELASTETLVKLHAALVAQQQKGGAK